MRTDGYIPPSAQRCVGFSDGSRYRIDKSGNVILQRRCFNGKDYIHCMEFQSTIGPDGMCMDFYGPVPGARHDAYINRESCVNARMEAAQV